MVLFFAGMSTRFSGRRLRIVMLACGFVVLATAIAWVATLPVSFQV